MLAKLLTDLKNKIDERYADQVDAVIEWSIGYDIGNSQKRVIDAAVLYVQVKESGPGIEKLYKEMQTAVLYFIDSK